MALSVDFVCGHQAEAVAVVAVLAALAFFAARMVLWRYRSLAAWEGYEPSPRAAFYAFLAGAAGVFLAGVGAAPRALVGGLLAGALLGYWSLLVGAYRRSR